MSNLQILIESFRKQKYKKVERNDYAYRQTEDFTVVELARLLEMYQAKIEQDQEARLIRDAMDHHIRRYHGYSIEGKIGAHYRQLGVDEGNCIFEHIIPATNVLAMLIEGRLTIKQALNTPTCLIKKEDDVILRTSGLGSSSPDNWNFFKRYSVLNSQFRTYNGQLITNPNSFTLDDHFKLFGIV